MKMEHLKCKTPDGVLKELMIFVLVYNLVRAAMAIAAERQGAEANRVSFIDALRWLRSQCTAPKRRPRDEIDLVVNSPRPGRWHPRLLKRRIKGYDMLNKPRRAYTQDEPEQGVGT